MSSLGYLSHDAALLGSLKRKNPRTSAKNPFDTTPVAPAPAKVSTPQTNNISLERRGNPQFKPQNLMAKIDGTPPVAQTDEEFWDCVCGNRWPLSKNRCSKPCFKWRKGARLNAKRGPNAKKTDAKPTRSLLKTRRSSKRPHGDPSAGNDSTTRKRKKGGVRRLVRRSTSPPGRKSPPDAPTERAATLQANIVDLNQCSIPMEILVGVLQQAGGPKDMSPMTERWKKDDESLRNTTISTITFPRMERHFRS